MVEFGSRGRQFKEFVSFSNPQRKAERALRRDPRAAKLPPEVRQLVIDSATKAATLPAAELVSTGQQTDAQLNGQLRNTPPIVSFIGGIRSELRQDGLPPEVVEQRSQQVFREELASRMVLAGKNGTPLTSLNTAVELAQGVTLKLTGKRNMR